MEILAIIPARGGSKGIPFKNIVKIEKKPLLYYTINAALKSKLVTRTIVSTDNEKISNTAKFYGSEVIKRPKQLSNDKIGLEPTINHVLDFLKNKEILDKELKQDNITILSPPIRASYNSPFTLPMLKRNEVMYRIDL